VIVCPLAVHNMDSGLRLPASFDPEDFRFVIGNRLIFMKDCELVAIPILPYSLALVQI
jgi:hypothetical protein